MILLVCALLQELRYAPKRADVERLAVGVGPVEAAAATARALARSNYDLVINAGIAGVFRGRGAIGDLRLVVRETLANLGLEGGGELALPPGTLVTTAEADRALVARCTPQLTVAAGLTVSEVTTTDRRAREHADRYDPDVETMEGFAVLRAAALASIPALELRGISNYVGDRAASGWDFDAGARAVGSGLTDLFDLLAPIEST